MKQINNYITEKLIINKNTGASNEKIKLDKITNNDYIKIHHIFGDGLDPHWGLDKHIRKMTEYMNKGSKPDRLIKSIKNISKLVCRWVAAIELDWTDAFDAFGKAIAERLNIDINILHQYICDTAIKKSNNKHYRHYVDFYNLDYPGL